MSLANNRTLQILEKAAKGKCKPSVKFRDDDPLTSENRWYHRADVVCRLSSSWDFYGWTELTHGSYDANSAIGLVRAAEKLKSPAILQVSCSASK